MEFKELMNNKFILASMTVGFIMGLGINQLYKQKNVLSNNRLGLTKQVPALNNRPQIFNTLEAYQGNNPGNIALAQNDRKDKDIFDDQEMGYPGKSTSQFVVDTPPLVISRGSDPTKSLLRLKDYIKNLEEKNNSLKEKVQLLAKMLELKEKYSIELNANLERASETHKKLKAEFDANVVSLNEKASLKDAEIAKLNAAKINLETQLKDLNAKLESLLSAQSALENIYNQIRQEKIAMGQELNKFKDDLNKQGVVSEALNKSIKELIQNLGEKEKELTNLNKELAGLKDSKNSLEQQLNNLKDDSNKQVILNETLNKNIAEITEKITDKEKENISLTKEITQLNQLKDDLSKQIMLGESLSKSSAELTQKITDKEKENIGLTKELTDLKVSKKNLELQLDELKNILAENAKEIDVLKQRLKETDRLYEDAKKTALEATRLITKRQTDTKDKQEEILNFQKTIAAINSEKENLIATLEAKEKKISELNMKVSDLESQIESLQKEADSLQKEATSYKKQQGGTAILEEKEKKISELNMKVNGLESQVASLQKEADSLRQEATSYKKQQGDTAILEEKDKRIGELDMKVNGLESQVASLQKEADSLRQEATSYKKQQFDTGILEEKEKKISALNTKVDIFETQVAVLQAEVVSYKKLQVDTAKQLEEAKSLNKALTRDLKSVSLELELLRTEKTSKDKIGKTKREQFYNSD